MTPTIRAMTSADVREAERITRIALGTFFGLPDPMQFRGDGEAVSGRFHANPDGAFVGELDGRLIASGVIMDWGAAAVLGPLGVDPDHWGKGIGHQLMDTMTDYLDRREFDFTGLFTHPQSASHIRLYEQFGFWMQRITGVMMKPVAASAASPDYTLFSEFNDREFDHALALCLTLTDGLHPGLDLSREIRTVSELGLGDTLLLLRDGAPVGFAICHYGARSEASSARLMVKFAMARSGEGDDFKLLLAACESLTARLGAPEIAAGANSGRPRAYHLMKDAGYRTAMNGVIMIRPDQPGYNRADSLVIDDWR
jgi:GNAT superfamily N-acetyltransferase